MLLDEFIRYGYNFFLDNVSDSFTGAHLYLVNFFFFGLVYTDLSIFLVTLGAQRLHPQLG